VIIEVLALGVVSALRPATSQAAVVALLRAPGASRLLLAFSIAGMLASTVAGTVIVVAFDGIGSSFGQSDFAAVFDVLAGVAAIAFAAGLKRGRVSAPRRRSDPGSSAAANPSPNGSSKLVKRLRQPSAATAAAAGVVTHVPGLIYVVALNAIAAEELGAAASAFWVAIYNLLWFSVPLAALALSIVAPGTADAYLSRAAAWARAHQTPLLVGIFGVLGIYLVIKGVVSLK
jgi:hypothetical protein